MIAEASTKWRQRGKEETKEVRVNASASRDTDGDRYVQIMLVTDREVGRGAHLNVYLQPAEAFVLGQQLIALSGKGRP